jgi:hypothetical protein
MVICVNFKHAELLLLVGSEQHPSQWIGWTTTTTELIQFSANTNTTPRLTELLQKSSTSAAVHSNCKINELSVMTKVSNSHQHNKSSHSCNRRRVTHPPFYVVLQTLVRVFNRVVLPYSTRVPGFALLSLHSTLRQVPSNRLTPKEMSRRAAA